MIAGLVLPDWSVNDRERAAALARDLLLLNGITELPGGVNLGALLPSIKPASDARVRLDLLAVNGFGLNVDQVRVLLGDFAERDSAVSAAHRAALLKLMSDGGNTND